MKEISVPGTGTPTLPSPQIFMVGGLGLDLLEASYVPHDRQSRYAIYWFLFLFVPIIPLKIYIVPAGAACGIRASLSQRRYIQDHGLLSYFRLLATSVIRFYAILLLILLLMTSGFVIVFVYLLAF